MMGGWNLRIQDLKTAVASSTATLHYENQQLQRLVALTREVRDHIENIKQRAAEIAHKPAPRGKSKMSLLPESDVNDLAMKVHDVKDQLAFMCKTHQFAFNPQLVEYIKKHVLDCTLYTEAEVTTLRLERRSHGDDQRGWLILQCETNMQELSETKIQFESLQAMHAERNKIVLQNEGYIIHIIHHVTKSVEAADEFLQLYRYCCPS
eukprot:PhM_4_TR7998/c0_g1_i2/m.86200